MIPLHDNIPARTKPVVNYSLIGVCSLVFALQLMAPGLQLAEHIGMIPKRVWGSNEPIVMRQLAYYDGGVVEMERTIPPAPVPPWLTVLSCIFLHGGWMHFLGNMWFLHIFGDNVEDRMGHVGYALFYVGAGLAASVAHLFVNAGSEIPTIGASGAIAGVMGAYMLLYPKSLVVTLVPIFFFIQIMVLPAPLFLGIWFLLQFFQGTLSITSMQTTGVAWWAHIGGFAAGFAVAGLLKAVGETRPPVQPSQPHTGRIQYRRRW